MRLGRHTFKPFKSGERARELDHASAAELLLLADWLKKIEGHTVARNTLWTMLGHMARLPVQAAYFVIIARSLGSQEFGRFSGVTALVAVVAPFASLGTGLLIIKDVSRKRSAYAACMGQALLTTTFLSLFLTAVLLFVSRFVMAKDIGPGLIIVLAISDLFFLNLHGLASSAFASVESLEIAAIYNFALGASKLLAAVIFAACFTKGDLEVWGLLYLLATAVPALAFYLKAHLSLGAPAWASPLKNRDWLEGLHFAVASSASSINSDIDKALLPRLGSPVAAGIYAAAYRFMNVALLPVKALISATLARFFKQGEAGPASSARYAWRLMPLPACYGVLASMTLYFSAPLIPLILGSDYAESAQALRWLAPLPILKILQEFPANALSGSGAQFLRTWTQIFVAAINTGLLIGLVPAYSWKGAALASVISDALQLACLFFALLWWCRRGNGAAVPGTAQR